MDAIHLFTLRGIPVRASFWFLLLVGYYAFALRGGGLPVILAFVIALTVSVLVHEFGHAFVARHFKLSPQVMLHGWGGLCVHERARSDRDDALIIAAGPAAGLALAGLVAIAEAAIPLEAQAHPFVNALLHFMWIINFWWSLINLLPLFPLDGGQLFRLGMLRLVKPIIRAERIVHLTGSALAVGGIVWGATTSSILITILSVLLLVQNIQMLSQGSPVPVRRRNTHVDDLLSQSRRELDGGDPREARRLAYQARDENNLGPDQVELTFQLLAVTSAALSDWEEAYYWAEKAPKTAELQALKIEALISLGRTAEAKAELANPYLLSQEAKARLEARLES
jgi:stage IV sporulation protein FB